MLNRKTVAHGPGTFLSSVEDFVKALMVQINLAFKIKLAGQCQKVPEIGCVQDAFKWGKNHKNKGFFGIDYGVHFI